MLDAADTGRIPGCGSDAFDKVIAFDNYRQKIILSANAQTDDLDHTYSKAMEGTEEHGGADPKRTEKHISLPLEASFGFRPLFEKEESAAWWKGKALYQGRRYFPGGALQPAGGGYGREPV